MICHLIGLNHSYQYRGCRDVNWEAFDACLFSFCRSAAVLLIAEELSEESIEKWAFRGAQGSVAKAVASRLGIEHQFCDPSPLERKVLGIPSTDELKSRLGIGMAMTHEQAALLDSKEKEYWPMREQFWMTKLQEGKVERCAFILGSRHVDSFFVLLSSHGIGAYVEHQNWEP